MASTVTEKHGSCESNGSEFGTRGLNVPETLHSSSQNYTSCLFVLPAFCLAATMSSRTERKQRDKKAQQTHSSHVPSATPPAFVFLKHSICLLLKESKIDEETESTDTYSGGSGSTSEHRSKVEYSIGQNQQRIEVLREEV
jgi:hypothetical protein